MPDPELDPQLKLALELAEREAPPDYPDYRRGAAGAAGGALLLVIAALLVSGLLRVVGEKPGSGLPLWSIVGMGILGALAGGGYFALRPPRR